MLKTAPNGQIPLHEFLGILDSEITTSCGRGLDRFQLYGEKIGEQGFNVKLVAEGLMVPTEKILAAMGAKLITDYYVEKSHE